jgi:hypothetical protein
MNTGTKAALDALEKGKLLMREKKVVEAAELMEKIVEKNL